MGAATSTPAALEKARQQQVARYQKKIDRINQRYQATPAAQTSKPPQSQPSQPESCPCASQCPCTIAKNAAESAVKANAEKSSTSGEKRNDRDDNGHPDSPIFHPGRSTHILISPGHGAGWVTWAPRGASDAFLVWMLTYEPIVHAVRNHAHKDRIEELLHDFHKEARNRYGVERLNTARAGDIEVREVNYPFEICEKDGREWIEDITHRAGGVGGKRHINM